MNLGVTYNLDVLANAESDIETAFIWYEEQEKGLGNRFLNEVENVFQYIENNP